MRVSREQATENRNRVLDAAATLFCRRGFDKIGVAEVMSAAGLTHGGFYGQFSSKDDLAAEACARVVDLSAQKWERLSASGQPTPLAAVVDSYLSSRHRDDAGSGCFMSTLAGDVARKHGPVRGIFTEGLKRMLAILTGAVPAEPLEARREKALATMAGLVGAVVLSRAVDDAALSKEILAAAGKTFGGSIDAEAVERPA